MENIKVKNAIISKQIKNSENYQKFLKIVKEKNINVIIVGSGNVINIDNNSRLEILWPETDQISDNVLNNNSIVAKFIYNNFSILFTGDIEEIAEKKIVDKYANKLIANAIKIAHHGSKTSSYEEFLQSVKPKIALIGVGENNKFGHPNLEVLERLNKLGTKVYRTDKLGEINIIVNKNGKIKICE